MEFEEAATMKRMWTTQTPRATTRAEATGKLTQSTSDWQNRMVLASGSRPSPAQYSKYHIIVLHLTRCVDTGLIAMCEPADISVGEREFMIAPPPLPPPRTLARILNALLFFL